jgi:hypothetical protein
VIYAVNRIEFCRRDVILAFFEEEDEDCGCEDDDCENYGDEEE